MISREDRCGCRPPCVRVLMEAREADSGSAEAANRSESDRAVVHFQERVA